MFHIDEFDKMMKMCLGFEDCINNEDKYFLECLELCEDLVKLIQHENLFSPNEEISDIDPKHLKFLLLPYYQAETLFRLMDDRKKRVQSAKQFYDEFLKLMNHYELLDEVSKKVWKASIHPEEARSAPKLSAMDERAEKIEEHKRKKLIEQKIEKLKDSEDDDDIKEFWMNMLYMAILKAISGLRSIDLEFQLLVYRDSLPQDQRGPSQPPDGPKKPLQTFHIPKGGLEGMPYMFGDAEAHAAQPNPNATSGSSVVKTYQETGERLNVTAKLKDFNDMAQLRDKYKAQVFQPGWAQPTMSLEEFGEMEYQNMMERENRERELKQEEEAKDDETREEEERQSTMRSDNMKDDIPKGYGNTKRL